MVRLVHTGIVWLAIHITALAYRYCMVRLVHTCIVSWPSDMRTFSQLLYGLPFRNKLLQTGVV